METDWVFVEADNKGLIWEWAFEKRKKNRVREQVKRWIKDQVVLEQAVVNIMLTCSPSIETNLNRQKLTVGSNLLIDSPSTRNLGNLTKQGLSVCLLELKVDYQVVNGCLVRATRTEWNQLFDKSPNVFKCCKRKRLTVLNRLLFEDWAINIGAALLNRRLILAAKLAPN